MPPVATGRKGTFPIACSPSMFVSGSDWRNGVRNRHLRCKIPSRTCLHWVISDRSIRQQRSRHVRFAPKANIPLRRFDPMSVHTARSKRRRHIDDAVLVIDRVQFGELRVQLRKFRIQPGKQLIVCHTKRIGAARQFLKGACKSFYRRGPVKVIEIIRTPQNVLNRPVAARCSRSARFRTIQI